MPRNNYPATAQECLDPNAKFRPEVLRVVRAFRRSKPWQGTQQERIIKFGRLHQQLCRIYRLRVALRFALDAAAHGSGDSHYSPAAREIVLYGRLSVITYLHEFAHAKFGSCERKAVTWSLNLFRRTFPRSFARLQFVGHMAIRADETRRTPRPGMPAPPDSLIAQILADHGLAAPRRRRRRRRGECPDDTGRNCKFSLGMITATPGALAAIAGAGQELSFFLNRHARGDWGDVDAEDREANNNAAGGDERILSAYKTLRGDRVWIITEADRSATTLLLPDEY